MPSPEEVEQIANEMIGGKLITKQTGAKGIMCNKVMLDRAMGCPMIIAT